MVNGLSIIDAQQRAKINEKFESLTLKFDLDRLWPETVATEKEDLQLFLLTSPTINDIEDYLSDRIEVWMIAEATFDDPAVQKKILGKMLTCIEMLVGFVDGLSH